jgi:Ca-activated chloride channel family protein
VVLLTDGENNAGSVNPETASRAVHEAGAGLFVIGIGQAGTVAIDYTDPATGIERKGFFESEADTASLRALAVAGDGVFLEAPSSEALNEAFRKMGDAVQVPGSTGEETRKTPLAFPFIASGGACLVLSWFIEHVLLGALL